MEREAIERRLDELRERLVGLQKAGAPEVLTRAFRALLDDFEVALAEGARAEARLRHETHFIERLVDTAQAIILVMDTDGRIVFFNPYLEEISGHRLEDVRGQDWFSTFLPERDRQRTSNLFRRAVRGTEVRGNVNPIVTKDGRKRHIEWYGKTLKDAHGEVTGLLSVGQDITDRLIQQNQLLKSEARMRAILDTTVDGIVSIDERGIVESFNASAEHIFGYTADEVVGRNVKLLMPPPYHDEHDGYLARYLETGEARIIGAGREVVGRRKDGTTFPMYLGVGEMNLDDKRGFTGIVRDLTEQKRLEIENRQAQKLQAVGTLAGGIAHDYNNLLMGILGCADLALKRVPAKSPARLYIEEARSAAKRGASLTRQLLTFSRRRETTPTTVDLDGVIGTADKMIRSVLGEQVEARFKLGAPNWRLRGDVGQLEQVLMNLVVNARDAMPDGGTLAIETAEIKVEPRSSPVGPSPGDYVVLTVSDTGKGMDAEVQERIFEPFFTTKELGKGTGLGLASVYGIVKESRGHIQVESAPGRGATFTLFFPRSSVAETVTQTERSQASEES